MATEQPEASADTTSVASPSTPTHSISSDFSFASGDNEFTINSANLTEGLATDYSKFFNFDTAKEETKFNDSVELMLTKLDEFFSLVDMIRSDTTLCLSNTLPDIQMKCQEMDALFEKIDRLEEFVSIVKESVTSVEEKVSKAESELGTVGGLVKKLTSFISKKPSPALTPPRTRGPEFVSPVIFSTSDYFNNTTDPAEPESASASFSTPVSSTDSSPVGEQPSHSSTS
ncbi:biogenesis of lysosomal organelles complex-1, subunit 4, cappuccino [Plakobranchus ocellatus]|uniref:Biogenesis of lysosomal organelles complex-1, subunit 4, cappuccino n=1 Tax=Plakobranchus ocellatus TaxID=259542 RepID=A0AAV3Y3Y8_9GAST|nr:biogenesis of lysosomal organelles complex-1, subunit 4, cappuccino [Plakobranchus ocellatus]